MLGLETLKLWPRDVLFPTTAEETRNKPLCDFASVSREKSVPQDRRKQRISSRTLARVGISIQLVFCKREKKNVKTETEVSTEIATRANEFIGLLSREPQTKRSLSGTVLYRCFKTIPIYIFYRYFCLWRFVVRVQHFENSNVYEWLKVRQNISKNVRYSTL